MNIEQALTNAFNHALDVLHEEILAELAYLGEESVVMMREQHAGDWTDRTGNLRSSTGYAIYNYGKKLIESSFSTVKNGSKGSAKGKKFVDELAAKYANTYTLVLLAGMDYAEFVEARGYDVVSGAALAARQKIDQRINKAVKRAEKRINRIMESL